MTNSSATSIVLYGTFGPSDFTCIDGLVGRQHPQLKVARAQRMLIFVNTHHQTLTKVSSRHSNNLGPIIGGIMAAVIVLALGAVLVWFFLKRRRTNQASRRNRLPVLESMDDALPPPQYLPPDARPALRTSNEATMQGPLSSHFYGPSDLTSQVPSKYRETSQPFAPQRSAPSPTTTQTSFVSGSNPSGVSLIRARAPSTSLSSTTTPSSPGMSNLSSLPSLPEDHQVPLVNEKLALGIMAPSSVQSPPTGGPPPSRFYPNVVANRVQAEIPDEPVEEGLMSRATSMRSFLPPYSPGGFRNDEDAPPIPER